MSETNKERSREGESDDKKDMYYVKRIYNGG